jgi:hypothetical protein
MYMHTPMSWMKNMPRNSSFDFFKRSSMYTFVICFFAGVCVLPVPDSCKENTVLLAGMCEYAINSLCTDMDRITLEF